MDFTLCPHTKVRSTKNIVLIHLFFGFAHVYNSVAIHSSHLYQSVWNIQMLGHRYLRKSEWWSDPKGTVYKYAGRVYSILLMERVILSDPSGVVDWESNLSQDQILLLLLTFY